MLLSFQRPSRPVGKVMPSSRGAPSTQTRRADGPVQYSADAGAGSTRPDARGRADRASAVSEQRYRGRSDGGRSAHAQAPEAGACRPAGRAPSRRSAGDVESSAPAARRRADAALGHQPPRLRARMAEGVGDAAPGRCTWPPVARDREVVDLVGRRVVDERRGRSAASARARRPRRRGSAPTIAARQRALGVARRAPRPAGARWPAARTSVPIASSGRRIVLPNISSGGSVDADRGCPGTSTSSRRRRCPGRIGIVRTACSGWP